MDRSTTYDFLSVFLSNYGMFRTVSDLKRDSCNISHRCVFNAPAEGVTLGIS